MISNTLKARFTLVGEVGEGWALFHKIINKKQVFNKNQNVLPILTAPYIWLHVLKIKVSKL